MNRIFEIALNMMGDTKPTYIQVLYSKKDNEYELGLKNKNENPKVTFNAQGNIVQTAGTPLDGNTLHHVSEELKKALT